MSAPATPSASPVAPLLRDPVGAGYWLWIALGATWVVLALRLASAWAASVEQAHGWVVPLLCAWLMIERKGTAPVAEAAGRGERRASAMAVTAGLLVLVTTVPVLEANRLWPTAQWVAAGGALLVSLGLLVCAGGWRWAGHFVFPLFFATTALTWPAAVQVPLLQGLARFNAALAAEAVSLLGHPAVVQGNLIEVGAGVVGVDEACAGLRSLQAVWMVSWFGGELLRLGAWRRAALVICGWVIAFAGNLLRTVFLTWRIALEGAENGGRWHDPAGTAAMVATFVAVGLAAWWLARQANVAPERRGAAPQTGVLARWVGLAVLVPLALTEAGTRAWFGWHERAGASAQWELRGELAGWTPLPISERIRGILRYSSGEGMSWTGPGGARQAVAYALRWEDAGQLDLAGVGHDPTVCMPSLGAELQAELPAETVTVEGREIVFAAYRFSGGGKTQHVFFCVWDAFHGRTMRERGDDFLPAHRLRRLADGRRRADAAHVVLVLQGEDSDASASAWLHETASTLLRAK
ncbi:MAG: exosortase/archaeosortase family protein [Candidatus Didemnitutus sp.]|nr:exosortase/archaeosortase family protein [Candidatus Didemnitutus sp.]